MEFLSKWARGIISIVILSGFLELLLPGDSIKKYVRLSVGIITITFMITPLAQIKNIELPDALEVSYAQYQAAGIHDTYVRRLEKKVEEALGVENIEITVNPEDITQILYVKSSEKHKEIAQLLGLTADKVGD
ncbi:MAG: stage III sporulation protein AF [Eubacteriales bacterium]|jgi:stage III sporulation protein AF|nr:stage III sporulation protein AF [Eubacteriales bacterium]